jgi:hypothetical protein
MYETEVPGAIVQPSPSWREETRRDRLVRAQIDRDRETARAQARIAEQEAAARVRRAAADARRDARAMARADRAARRAALAAWAAGHVTDFLFVPVIAVPAVLAWTAMAVYGASLYGPAGRALPAFSEGAMWAFAAAVTITCHRHPGRPVWHLRLGTVVFAGFGAALNFAHGLTAYGPVAGVVMALISVAGVTAHQLVTAGPRRTRADRDAARTARAIGRRERAAHRAAVRRALVDLDENGSARLVFKSGAAMLERHLGRIRLTPPPPTTSEALPGAVPSDVVEAAKASLRATIAAGNPWSVNQLSEQFSLTRAQATKLRKTVLAESGGDGPEDPRGQTPETPDQ